MSAKKARDLAYGDLFELADLPVFNEVHGQARELAEHAYARVQSESYYEGGHFWLDTSFGFFRVDPDFEVEVHRNEPHLFARRNKR